LRGNLAFFERRYLQKLPHFYLFLTALKKLRLFLRFLRKNALFLPIAVDFADGAVTFGAAIILFSLIKRFCLDFPPRL